MSRLLSRLSGRVYGWFQVKEAGARLQSARCSERARLMLLSLEDRVVPATILVTNDSDAGAGSLRQAITDANLTVAQDTLLFDTAFFNTSMKTITLATPLPAVTTSVIIAGPGADLATVNGNATGTIFNLASAAFGTMVTVQNLRLTGGISADRGGVFNLQDEVLKLSGVTLENNSSTNAGGAIALLEAAATLFIDNSIIRNNTAGSHGGGIEVHRGSQITIDRTTISGNTAGGDGGGIYFYDGMNFKLTNSTISGNLSNGSEGGGGLYFWGGIGFYGLTILNSTIANNTAAANGGGIDFHDVGGSPVIQNCTIIGNSAGNGGGIAIPNNATNLTIGGTIVAQNNAAIGPDISVTSAGAVVVNVNFSAVGDAAGFTPSPTSGNNIAPGTPLLLNPLASNGGPTQTVSLQAGSPALNAGSNAAGLATDQRGSRRESPTGRADIGAFESPPLNTIPVTGTGPLPTITVANAATVDPYVFVVSYANATAMNAATLGNDDLRVTGPGGFNSLATFVNSIPAGDATVIDATYKVAAPAGGWTPATNGTYTIAVEANKVTAVDTTPVPTGPVGTFVANIGQTFTVTNTGDSGAGSLRSAIIAANADAQLDRVAFDASFNVPQTITLTGGEIIITQNLVLGGPAVNVTISGNKASRIFSVDGPGTLAVEINHVTLVNGSTAGAGGAIRVQDEVLTLNDSTLNANTAAGNGGGIALNNTGGKLFMTRTTVSNNKSSANGGGLDTGGFGATVVITDSAVIGNATSNSGGGLGQFNGLITIVRSTFSGNIGTNSSGALYLGNTIANIDSSTISGNTTNGFGGGINFVAHYQPAFIRNSTITANSSAGGGGGISRTSGGSTFILDSTIVAGNTNAATPDIRFSAASGVFSSFSLVGAADVGLFALGGVNNLTGTKAAPLNPRLGFLSNNGGYGFTHALLAISPAINAGANTVPQALDQRGSPRENPAGLPDIGAFERVIGTPSAQGGTFVTITQANAAAQNPYVFTVTYANEDNINVATLDNNDIRVTGPAGFNALATFVSSTPATNATSIVATYKLAAPGSGWTPSANGSYLVSVEPGQVGTVAGKFAEVTGVGSFLVAISASFTVTNTNDSGVGSLRQAILDANLTAANDFIAFGTLFGIPQTISLTSGELLISQNLVITGPAVNVTVSGTFNSRVFNVAGAGTLNVDISRVTMTDGVAPAAGGGISIDNEIVTLTDCVIANNSSTGNGGGLALLSSPGKLTLTRTVVTGNRGTGNGGGLDTGGFGANVTITDSTISNNTTSNDGGGLGQFNGSISFLRSTISGNIAGSSSGGLFLGNTGTTIINCTISGNTSGNPGGAINFVAHNITANIFNSTITGNTSNLNGGGIHRGDGPASVNLISTIVAGNVSLVGGGPDLHFNAAATVAGGNNLVGVADLGNFTLSGVNLTGTSGAPLDPLIGNLTNNGGPTATHAILPGSPAINTGANPTAQNIDQRFGGRVLGGATDIGAFERIPGTPAAVPGPFINVTVDDASTNPYTFFVTYSDDAAIDVATLDGNDILVTGPNGFSTLATFTGVDVNTNGTPRTATYSFVPPGGTWNFADNGTYTVALQANQVKSTVPTAVPAVTLGTFKATFAGTYLVTNSNDSGAGSLRNAIIGSNSTPGLADTILFDPAFFNTSMKTIALASTLPFFSDAATITGPGATLATVSGQSKVRLFNFDSAPSGAVFTVSGLTLANASTAGNGGAVKIGDESVTLTNLVIQNNKAAEGGAISVAAGAAVLNVMNTTISGNTAFAEDGGAIEVAGAATVNVFASTLSGNSASSDGGGIYFAYNGNLTVTRSTISGNTASGVGGAFNGGGAGIYFYGTAFSPIVISNSTISGNTHTSLPGGGITLLSFSGAIEINNSTIVGNKGSNGGGLVKAGGGTVTLTSSIVAGNTTSGGGVALDVLAPTASILATNSAVGSDATGSLNSYGTGQNIPLGTPLLLGALANNGGPTQTHLPNVGSPLLDAGANPSPLTPDVDQIGHPRTFGVQTDIGAVELQAGVTGFVVNNGAVQRSRLTTITVTFAAPVSPAGFSGLGAIVLTRTAATPTGTIGTIVQTGATGANGLITVSQPGPTNQLVLTFSNANGANETAGVEYGSLADGRWRLSIPVASQYQSALNDVQLRRLFGDFEAGPGSNGTVDAGDFATFGGAFGSSGAPGFSPFDYDNNGTIDSGDLGAIGARFGFSV